MRKFTSAKLLVSIFESITGASPRTLKPNSRLDPGANPGSDPGADAGGEVESWVGSVSVVTSRDRFKVT